MNKIEELREDREDYLDSSCFCGICGTRGHRPRDMLIWDVRRCCVDCFKKEYNKIKK